MSFRSLFNRNADFVGNRYENAADRLMHDHPQLATASGYALAAGIGAAWMAATNVFAGGTMLSYGGAAGLGGLFGMILAAMGHVRDGEPVALAMGGMVLDSVVAAAATVMGIDLGETAFAAAEKTITGADKEKITEQLSRVSPRDYFDEPKTYGEFRARMIGERAERNPFKVIGMALTGA